MRKVIYCLFFLTSLFCQFSVKAAGSSENPELYIECHIDDNTIYERQPVSAVVTLISSTPNIAYANVSHQLELNKEKFATFQKVSSPGRAYEKNIKGKRMFCFPLEAFVFTIANKGSYDLVNGEYKIGVSIPTVVNDPFWGPVRSSEVEQYSLSVRKSSIKVKALPKTAGNSNFSGSVGTFSIETIIPAGDIFVNEDATAIIVLKGTGMIEQSVLPEYRGAFINGCKLKSVSESRNEVYDNGKLISELRLECTFIPTERSNVEIGSVSFDFFNPDSGKYETIRSKPVKVTVKSSTSKRERITI